MSTAWQTREGVAGQPAPPVASPVASPVAAGERAGGGPADDRPDANADPHVAELLRWLQIVAAQPTRAAAMQRLAIEFQAASGASAVRIAWGNRRKLRRMFDTRLGSLGAESSLWKEIADQWEVLIDGDADWSHVHDDWILRLPQSDGSGRALLWLTGRREGTGRKQLLAQAAGTIAAVLWCRPPIRFPLRLSGDRRKSITLAALLFLALAAGALPVPYRVACTARVEPIRQRIVAAPFEAALLECHVQPGDAVATGDLLVVLDGRPLQLEMEALQADSQHATKQHDAALATGRIADAQLADLERRQLQRRIDLLQQRLVGLEVRSPIDGVVVSGDLQQSIGSPVETGQQLLEIAPLRQLTMEVEIPERDIHYIRTGAEVRVRLDAAAIHAIDGQLEVLFPAAELRDERNVFVGQWEVDNASGSLRPGMRGSALVYGPRRPLAWPLMRSVIESTLRTIGW